MIPLLLKRCRPHHILDLNNYEFGSNTLAWWLTKPATIGCHSSNRSLCENTLKWCSSDYVSVFISENKSHKLPNATTVTPFKFAAIKVHFLKSWHIRGRLISRFPTQVLCFPTQIKVGTIYVKDNQVLRLEHRLGLMEILQNLKRNILV